MKIVILGAGQVGSSLAEHLSLEEGNDVTIIDINSQQLSKLQDKLDIRTICGNACFPNILIASGIEEADMLIAVTSNDEVNMIACQIAHGLFQTTNKIARIRSLQYLSHNELFTSGIINIDVLISPEQLVTNHINRLITYPDALQVLDFADGKVQLIAIKAYYGGALVGKTINTLSSSLQNFQFKIVAIFRDNKFIEFTEDTIIMALDEILFFAQSACIKDILIELHRTDSHYNNKRIMIAGGGNIGMRLALSLEEEFQVKIIERNNKRIEKLATILNQGIVLHGNAQDKDLLLNENIENTDVFCAVTNFDEANIMSAILAKRLGARKVMALVNSSAYVDVIEGSEIDIAISPQQMTIDGLLAYLRQSNISRVYSLRRGTAEALELAASSKDNINTKVVGKTVPELKLPREATVGAIIKNDNVIIDDSLIKNITIDPLDKIIIFLEDKKRLTSIQKLFENE